MSNELWQKSIEEVQKSNQEDETVVLKMFSSDAHAVFEDNPKGKKFLEILEAYYLKDLAVADPSESVQQAFWREGQNSIIRHFRWLVNHHKLYMQGDIK